MLCFQLEWSCNKKVHVLRLLKCRWVILFPYCYNTPSRFQLKGWKTEGLDRGEFCLSGSTRQPHIFLSCALKRALSVWQAHARTHTNTNWVSQGIFSSLFPPSAPILFTLECLELLSIARRVPPIPLLSSLNASSLPDTLFASPVSCMCRSDHICHFSLLNANTEQQQLTVWLTHLSGRTDWHSPGVPNGPRPAPASELVLKYLSNLGSVKTVGTAEGKKQLLVACFVSLCRCFAYYLPGSVFVWWLSTASWDCSSTEESATLKEHISFTIAALHE